MQIIANSTKTMQPELAGNIVICQSGVPVTTSLAIAEGVGNTHKTVIQLIRKNIDDLQEFGSLAFEMRPFDTVGGSQNREIAMLNEQQATLLISFMRNIGVVKEFKKNLVKAFFDMRDRLNQRQQHIDPMEALRDPTVMRGLLLGYSEKMIELEDKLKVSQPKADALDRLAKADGSLCITDAAKQLQVRPKDLFLLLQCKKWIYRRQGSSWLGYQDKIQQALVEHKVTEVEHSSGLCKVSTQVRITMKGLAKLSGSMLNG
ncbi:phage regulatory protein/antirepressor Ant [Shewanella sp. T24-MNA-CIBAN-0130]|uniref:phage regulatory protein/antirepressor Ant n=1 Tax=Shewanella sp. T24-MNA-CIBAN-0130 TaxID=3140470 RepID=UPI003325A8FE